MIDARRVNAAAEAMAMRATLRVEDERGGVRPLSTAEMVHLARVALEAAEEAERDG